MRFVTGPVEEIMAGRSEDERRREIAEAAYFKALCRGFAPGHEREDWLAAEREVDARRYQ
jgi:hypothetical protein